MLLRGYLPIISGASLTQFLQSERVNCENLKPFLLDTTHRLKWHAERMVAQTGRPFEYLSSGGLRMEHRARELAERDGVTKRPVCVFPKQGTDKESIREAAEVGDVNFPPSHWRAGRRPPS
jgi:hypothetical protein